MTNKIQFLIYDNNGRSTNFIIGTKKVSAPAFTPEIKNSEDLEVLLRFENAMDVNNPIMVPANLWRSFVENPKFKKRSFDRLSLSELVWNHPILFYEPPELFRYKIPGVFLSYSVGGNSSKKKEFKKHLRAGNVEAALNVIPSVYQAFMRRQIYELCETERISIPPTIQKSSVVQGWWDGETSEFFPAHILEMLLTALKAQNAAIIPPVPPISKSNVSVGIRRTLAVNSLTSHICRRYGQGKVYPYFHAYIDWQTLNPILNLVPQIIEAFEEELSTGDYCGVAITINGWQTACSKGKFEDVEALIQEIINIAHENYLPVMLPRSGWYGLYLTDYGVQAFSSLLNGAERYTSYGGRGEPEDQYGKIPVYGICKELKYREILRYLKTRGEFPDILGLPKRPDPDAMGNPRKFRVLFGKPWRLSHCQEAREVRSGLIQGVKSPAKRYLERSKHTYLKNI